MTVLRPWARRTPDPAAEQLAGQAYPRPCPLCGQAVSVTAEAQVVVRVRTGPDGSTERLLLAHRACADRHKAVDSRGWIRLTARGRLVRDVLVALAVAAVLTVLSLLIASAVMAGAP